MGNFTFEEMNLLCIYNTNTGSRTELIEALTEMRALGKLQAMSDTEFAELELYPDF